MIPASRAGLYQRIAGGFPIAPRAPFGQTFFCDITV